MRKLFLTSLLLLVAVTAPAQVTTATLMQEYDQVKKQVAEGQAQLLRLEGAIRVLEVNAESASHTVAADKATTPTVRQAVKN